MIGFIFELALSVMNLLFAFSGHDGAASHFNFWVSGLCFMSALHSGLKLLRERME
jgi:hypothetical protein